ncbi:MAG: amidohydrolase family protein [Gemmatimonadaceae bacterium]
MRLPIDVQAYVGQYPFRHLPHPDPEVLVRVLAREGVGGAWVGHLPTAFHRDPGPGNEALYESLEAHRAVLHPAPAVRPDWPGWERELARAIDRGAPAIRAYPMHWGLGAGDAGLARLVGACGEAGAALVLTAKFEDLRQRHPLDAAGDLTGAHVRAIARASRATNVVVCGAGREVIEESFWGLTSDERSRLYFDVSWIWGPPEDHLAKLFRAMGADRFVFGTGWPLRLTQVPIASLDLLPDDVSERGMTDAGTLARKEKGERR